MFEAIVSYSLQSETTLRGHIMPFLSTSKQDDDIYFLTSPKVRYNLHDQQGVPKGADRSIVDTQPANQLSSSHHTHTTCTVDYAGFYRLLPHVNTSYTILRIKLLYITTPCLNETLPRVNYFMDVVMEEIPLYLTSTRNVHPSVATQSIAGFVHPREHKILGHTRLFQAPW